MSTLKIIYVVHRSIFVAIVVLSIVKQVRNQVNNGTHTDGNVNVDPYKIIGTSGRQYSAGRQVLDFRRNGFRVDIRVVPSLKNDSAKDDDFPEFPTTDIGRCVIDFSLICAKKRLGRFLDSIRDLNEIYLMGQDVKLVKTRVINDHRSVNDSNDTIERSINDFFDTFALRITLPRWNGNREKNQIDVMFDETPVSEGRGKGGGKGGKDKGGKCKTMMMAGLMMLKMKFMGVATMKGMMMAGMSLMISMAMLMQKYMKGGGNGGGGGGGGGNATNYQHYHELL
uniref:uncharacterized protein LOC117157384 n=1 Tax=Bombus vancouverensis nearcticus TaxID=2705178 RepID=UPI00143AC45A|nr:uncharacterized protein LOC117157384 [Bombus vancouverensis nearcticus]